MQVVQTANSNKNQMSKKKVKIICMKRPALRYNKSNGLLSDCVGWKACALVFFIEKDPDLNLVHSAPIGLATLSILGGLGAELKFISRSFSLPNRDSLLMSPVPLADSG